MRTFSMVVIAGLAVAGAILGYRVLAGNDDERADPQRPETATPSPEEEEGYWTPERLKEARPIEMPYAPGSPTPTEDPGTSHPHGVSGPWRLISCRRETEIGTPACRGRISLLRFV